MRPWVGLPFPALELVGPPQDESLQALEVVRPWVGPSFPVPELVGAPQGERLQALGIAILGSGTDFKRLKWSSLGSKAAYQRWE